MKDAFKKKIELGSTVLYSVNNSAGTVYNIGEVVKLHKHKNDPCKRYCPPDRVEINVTKRSPREAKFMKNPVLYASNVVVLPVEAG